MPPPAGLGHMESASASRGRRRRIGAALVVASRACCLHQRGRHEDWLAYGWLGTGFEGEQI
jgi:hypothetical protein